MVELEFDENGIFAEALVPRYLEYEEPPVQMVEFLRYSGIPIDAAKRMLANPDSEESGQVMEKAEKVMALSKGQFVFKVGYLAGALPWDEDGFPVLPISGLHRSSAGMLPVIPILVIIQRNAVIRL